METITTKQVRKKFITKGGLPKREYIKTNIDLLNDVGININRLSKSERFFAIQKMGTIVNYIGNDFIEHHCNFISFKKQGQRFVYHGFSENPDYIKNNSFRIEKRKKNLITKSEKVKVLTNEQLLLFDDNEKQYVHN